VLPEFRAHNIGAPLVRYAVATAGALGGAVMVAHIQPPNVRFFERLGWTRDGDAEIYCGLPHQPMRVALTAL
jgi:predicted N-acetyltransferase YhbS